MVLMSATMVNPPPLMASSQSAPNHPSALQNKSFVSSYLMACCESNETAGPFSSPPFFSNLCLWAGNCTEKKWQTESNSWLILPTGHSVNDGILWEDFSPKYDTVDMAISAIIAQEPGSFLTKVDVHSAFRLCPLRPAD